MGSETDKRYKRIENSIDLAMLYMAIANQPQASQGIRKMIDDLIKEYMDSNNTSLDEIIKRNVERLGLEKWDSWDKLKKGVLSVRMRDIRRYYGLFTGKMVKPLDGESLEGFQRGDHVIVFHAADYYEFQEIIDKILHGTEEEKAEIRRRYLKKEGVKCIC